MSFVLSHKHTLESMAECLLKAISCTKNEEKAGHIVRSIGGLRQMSGSTKWVAPPSEWQSGRQAVFGMSTM